MRRRTARLVHTAADLRRVDGRVALESARRARTVRPCILPGTRFVSATGTRCRARRRELRRCGRRRRPGKRAGRWGRGWYAHGTQLYEPDGFDEMFGGLDVDRTMTLPVGLRSGVRVRGRGGARRGRGVRLHASRVGGVGGDAADADRAARGARVAGCAASRVPARSSTQPSGGPRRRRFAPALDIASMAQQYVHSRLFRS